MRKVLIIFGMLGGAVLGLALMVWASDVNNARHSAKIKFKTFKHFYEINPDRWVLHEDCVLCKLEYMVCEKLRFGFIDFLRYVLWRTAKNRNNVKKGQVESMSKVIAAVKEDIKNLEIFAEQQVNEGVDMINDILQEKKK